MLNTFSNMILETTCLVRFRDNAGGEKAATCIRQFKANRQEEEEDDDDDDEEEEQESNNNKRFFFLPATRMSASVVKQDPNTQKVQNEAKERCLL